MLGFSTKAAGLSIEQSGIRYISMKNKTQVGKKRYLPLPPGIIVDNLVADSQALLEKLKPWVRKNGLRGGTVHLSIPPSQMIIRQMTIPSIHDKQVQQLVKLEVETGLHLPFDNPVYDYIVTDRTENESRLLVFATPRSIVQDYVDVLEKAGVKIRTVELSAMALARSIGAGYGHAFGETMLIHMEHALLDIYMFRDGNPVFIRTINLTELQPGGGAAVSPELPVSLLSSSLEAAPAAEESLHPEQMVEIGAEISRMLSFYQYSLHDGNTRITEMLITGSPVLRSQLQSELQASLPELAIAQIGIDSFAPGTRGDAILNDYRLAVGAALKKKEEGIDLMPREDRETILFPYLAVSLAGIWLLGSVATGILHAGNLTQSRGQEAELAQIRENAAALQLEIAQLSGKGSLDREAVLAAIAAARPDAAAILDELQAALPQGGAIRDTGFTHQSELLLTVNFLRMEEGGAYLTGLREMSFARGAVIQKLTEETIPAGAQAAAAGAAPGIRYTALYKVSLSAAGQPDGQAAAAAEEGGGDGEN